MALWCPIGVRTISRRAPIRKRKTTGNREQFHLIAVGKRPEFPISHGTSIKKTHTQIEPGQALQFIAGNGPPTRFWHRKHETLTGFYRFAIARGYVGGSPLPTSVPKLSR